MPVSRNRKKRHAPDVMSAALGEEKHVPRPRNSFMLFRCWLKLCNVLPSEEQLAYHGTFAKWTGYTWRSRSQEVKNHFHGLAEEEKQEHMRLYPDYVYRPRYKKKKGQAIKPKRTQGKGKGKATFSSSSRSIEDVAPLAAIPFPVTSASDSSSSQSPLSHPMVIGQGANLLFPSVGSVARPVVSNYIVSSASDEASVSPLDSFDNTFDDASGKGKQKATSSSSSHSIEDVPALIALPFPVTLAFDSSSFQSPLSHPVTIGQGADLLFPFVGSVARPVVSNYTVSSASNNVSVSPLNSFDNTFDVASGKGKQKATSSSSSHSIEDVPALTALPFPVTSAFDSSSSQSHTVPIGQGANLFFPFAGAVARPVGSEYTANSASDKASVSPFNSFDNTFNAASGIPASIVNLDLQDSDIRNVEPWAEEQSFIPGLDDGLNFSWALDAKMPSLFELEGMSGDVDFNFNFDNNFDIQYGDDWNQLQTPGAGPSSQEAVVPSFETNPYYHLSFDSSVDFIQF